MTLCDFICIMENIKPSKGGNMPRKALNPSGLMKWRLNQGITTRAIKEKTGLSQPSIYRIERGDAVARVKVQQYLSYWKGDLNNLRMFPAPLTIIDEGTAVRISFSHITE